MKKKIPARGSLIIKEIKLKEKDVGVEGGGGGLGERERERERNASSINGGNLQQGITPGELV
jgi:hypothetical protein